MPPKGRVRKQPARLGGAAAAAAPPLVPFPVVEPLPFAPDAPGKGGSELGHGSFASVYQTSILVARRKTKPETGPDGMQLLHEGARDVFNNVYAQASEITASLDVTNGTSGIVRALHVRAQVAPGNKLQMVYTMPLFWGGSLEDFLWKKPPKVAIDMDQRMQIAQALLWGLVRMRAMSISHQDIKPANILVRQLDDKKTWQVAYADFDTFSMPAWYGAPTTTPLMGMSTEGYRFDDVFATGRNVAAFAHAEHNPPNAYLGERATDSNDVWAVMCSLWGLFFDDYFEKRHKDGTFSTSGDIRRFKGTLNVAIGTLVRQQFSGDGNDPQVARIRATFSYVLDTMAVEGDGSHLRAIDMYKAFMGDQPIMRTPVFMWRNAANPIAGLPNQMARMYFKMAVRDIYAYGDITPQLADLFTNIKFAAGVPAGSVNTRVLRIWGYLTFASVVSRAISLVASFFVHNPGSPWPPVEANANLLHFIMYISIATNIPYVMEILGVSFTEPLIQLYMHNLSELGFVTARGRLEVLAWQKKLNAENNKRKSGSTEWAPMMVYLVNSSKRWFGNNFYVPSTLTLITHALHQYMYDAGLDVREHGHDVRAIVPFYTRDILTFIGHMMLEGSIDAVIKLHQDVNCIQPSSSGYDMQVGRHVGSMYSAHVAVVPSLAQVFSTVSA